MFGMQIKLRDNLVDIGLVHTMILVSKQNFNTPTGTVVFPIDFSLSTHFVYIESYDGKPHPYLNGNILTQYLGAGNTSSNFSVFIIKYT